MEPKSTAWVIEQLREIERLAAFTPSAVGHVALTDIAEQARLMVDTLRTPTASAELGELRERITTARQLAVQVLDVPGLGSWARARLENIKEVLSAVESQIATEPTTIAQQLAGLVTPRNVGSPSDPDPYPGTVGDVADEIAIFIDGMECDGIANGLRMEVSGRLVDLDRQRIAERERAAAERRQQVVGVLRTVAFEHLYPALREIGIEKPEETWELRGRWEADSPETGFRMGES